MTFTVPDGLFDIYNEMADFLIDNDNIGKDCTLIYPELKTQCANCVMSTLPGASSTNVYKNGGPMPFSFGPCPMCGGQGFKSVEQTDPIRLRIYWSSKDFIKVDAINVKDGDVMVIGYLSDLAKFRRADQVILVKDQKKHQSWNYSQRAEAFPHGFGKDRYFVCFMNRVD